jgi:hypothetical protein
MKVCQDRFALQEVALSTPAEKCSDRSEKHTAHHSGLAQQEGERRRENAHLSNQHGVGFVISVFPARATQIAK